MEEWVGAQWHRLISRAADREFAAAAVRLADVERQLRLLFHAAGGAPLVRIAPASAARAGGPRGWLLRIAGAGRTATTGRLEPDVLAMPASIAVFADRALNRDLYLWLAALGAVFESSGDWVGDNVRATARALDLFPGLRERHANLVAAELALRSAPMSFRAERGIRRAAQRAAHAEAIVQRALRGERLDTGVPVSPTDVAPVWTWLTAAGSAAPSATRDDAAAGSGADHRPTQDTKRRHGERVRDERNNAPLMMFFRAESILSWGEFVHVNRASDDGDDNARAADDMETLAIATGDTRTAARVRFDLDLPSAAADDAPVGPGLRLSEWDYRARTLRADHCGVQMLVAPSPPAFAPPPELRAVAARVRRRMEVLRAAPLRAHAQPDGDELDLDAWVRFRVDAASAPVTDAPAVFTRRVRAERSLATLLLADLSLSTDAYASDTARVIDVIRDALYVFGEALAASGDAFEMLGFSSVRRQHVRIHHLKGFGEPWAGAARDRVGAIKPGYYTRMGAAIRVATMRLQGRGERQRLLLILTDGKPNDLDVYEGRYGLEDTRHAVQAARDAGLVPFCVTIDEAAHDYLPMLFGARGFALVRRPQDLVQRLAGVYAQLTRGR